MSNQQTKILGVNVSNLTFKEVLESIEKYLQKFEIRNSKLETDERKPLVIFTPNPEIIVYAQKDAKFKEIVNTAQINVPDGMGLVWASQILGQPLKEKIGGTDLMEKLVELARDKSLTVGLIGGKRGVALKALECLLEKYPGLKGWAEEGPRLEMGSGKWENGNRNGKWKNIKKSHFSLQNPASHISHLTSLVNKIQQTKTSFIFVGLGCPKQEYFINNIIRHSGKRVNERIQNPDSGQARMTDSPLVLMSVGGSFDYFSGRVKRAPLFIRSIGFEWVFRLFLQPWRWKRQLAILKFAWLVVKQKLDTI